VTRENPSNPFGPATVPGDAGLIDLVFTKTPVSADLTAYTDKNITDGRIFQVTGYNYDTFSAVASGGILGSQLYAANEPGGLQLETTSSLTISKARPKLTSLIGASQLSDDVKLRLETLALRAIKH
jgi:hypothetical protein